jgi:hypothetical protein
MLIAIEGCAGVGKTTYVTGLEKAGARVYWGQRERPRTHTRISAAGYSSANDFGALATAICVHAEHGKDLYTDRFCLTHAVYHHLRTNRDLAECVRNQLGWYVRAREHAAWSVGYMGVPYASAPETRFVVLHPPLDVVLERRACGREYAFDAKAEHAAYGRAIEMLQRYAVDFPGYEVVVCN